MINLFFITSTYKNEIGDGHKGETLIMFNDDIITLTHHSMHCSYVEYVVKTYGPKSEVFWLSPFCYYVRLNYLTKGLNNLVDWRKGLNTWMNDGMTLLVDRRDM